MASPYLAVFLALLAWWLSVSTHGQPLSQQTPLVQQKVILDERSDHTSVALMVTLVPAPNFAAISSSDTRKQSFIAWLLPLISQENERIGVLRQEAVELYQLWQTNALSLAQKEWLVDIATDYEVDIDDAQKNFTLEFWQSLLHRLDRVPPSLVLTQAAIETGWGTSRLAQEAHNFFGIMCFTSNCGVKVKGIVGEYRRFKSAQASVAFYMHILNTKGAYQSARMERMHHRLLGHVPSGLQLAKTLLNYSELGQGYVNFVIKVMRSNQLEDYDGAELSAAVDVIAAPEITTLNREGVD
jgi:Bax protein